jgi:hypothetical protein
MLMLTYFAALHNNGPLLLLLGLPLDRALPWHKLLALSTLANSAVHLAVSYATQEEHVGSTLATGSDSGHLTSEGYLVSGWDFRTGMEASGAHLHARGCRTGA